MLVFCMIFCFLFANADLSKGVYLERRFKDMEKDDQGIWIQQRPVEWAHVVNLVSFLIFFGYQECIHKALCHCLLDPASLSFV